MWLKCHGTTFFRFLRFASSSVRVHVFGSHQMKIQHYEWMNIFEQVIKESIITIRLDSKRKQIKANGIFINVAGGNFFYENYVLQHEILHELQLAYQNSRNIACQCPLKKFARC